jgi:uncharacterized protein (DUF488 family)
VYTIGHSNHPIDVFLDLLARHRVQGLADVRSVPHSRFARQYNRRSLERALDEAGIRYLYLGAELGGRPEEAELRDELGHVRYDLVAAAPRFSEGLARLGQAATAARVAVMCSEEDPTRCHRRLLLAPALVARGVEVRHIRKDGSVVVDGQLDPGPTLF